jgi:hypothetical protein
MKKLFLLFIILFNISLVFAGKSIELDFEARDDYLVPLYKGDRVYFEFDGETHSIILDELLDNRIELDLFLYQDDKLKGENPKYAFMDTSHNLRLDTNLDDIYDFEVVLNDYDDEKALIKFVKIDIPKYLKTEEMYVFYKDPKIIGVLAGILAILIAISLIDRAVKKNKGTYY